MLYLNNNDIQKVGIEWRSVVNVIYSAVISLDEKDFSQPIKPYLRYGSQANRIIAMPAYVGGEVQTAGIKWIASFPDNLVKGLPRAHSVLILNESDTGRPFAVINSGMISAIRTAGVSGALVDEWLKGRDRKDLTVGICGFGPIGRMHLRMMSSLFAVNISRFMIFDLASDKLNDIGEMASAHVTIAKSWEDMYDAADIFITCTVSGRRYIDRRPKRGSLQLNVSLRDYAPEIRQYMNVIVVDDWDEVCRENTDIQAMHEQSGLQKKDTISFADVICGQNLGGMGRSDVVMFNPMGMAVFDIAVGKYFCQLSKIQRVGKILED
jgi:2,3-diaminopropionate biosynthesis protein SbnB